MSNFVTIESSENNLKMKNLFNIWTFIWFVWILFHFTIIFFFWLVLESPLLVGLFLWIWNLVALILDIPIWVLQKYIKAKTFLIISASLIILTLMIFTKFIFFTWSDWTIYNWLIDKTIWYIGIFLNSTFNIILLLFAACLYWIIKESFDITTLSYILNNSTPSEYANLISKYSIRFWAWALVWLIFSWILLAFDIKIAITFFMFIVFIFIWFIAIYFDNTSKTINIDDFKNMKNIKFDQISNDLTKKANWFVSKINVKNLIELSRNSKVILLKPVEIKKNFNFTEITNTTIENFSRFKNTLFKKPLNLVLFWFLFMIMQFWFWDTFVSTFQIEFLDKIISINRETFIIKQTGWLISWYVLLWIMVIPAFLLQEFFINLSKKIWIFKVVMFWVAISWVSLFFFWLVDKIYLVLLFWLLNSVWYAAVMPLAQATFWEIYNIDYANKYKLKETDSIASAAPLKIVLNLANVVGLILWGLLVSVLWFNWFFIVFSLLIFCLLIYSFLNIKLFSKISSTENNQEQKINNEIDPDFI